MEECVACKHCNGTGDCTKGEVIGIKCSCEYCLEKANLKSANPFLIVSCARCEGKGFLFLNDHKSQEGRNRTNKSKRRWSR